jgi:hypothetical protein
MQLHTVNEKKPMKKFMGRKRKSTKEKSKKHHPIARLWLRDGLGAGEDDLCRGCKEAFLLGLRQICSGDGGCGPTNCLFLHRLLCHLVAMGDTLDGHAMAKRSELRSNGKDHGRKEEEEGGGGGEAKIW